MVVGTITIGIPTTIGVGRTTTTIGITGGIMVGKDKIGGKIVLNKKLPIIG